MLRYISRRAGCSIVVLIQNRPDFPGQLFQGERLLQEVGFDVDHFMIDHGLPGVAGNE